MVQIKKMLVPASRASRVRFSGTNPKRKIVVHQTGNTKRGANAYMHARLQYNGNSRAASWHYQVDDKIAYQSFSHNDRLWHAGNGTVNKNSIGVEICVNSDGNYDQAVKNGVELVKWIMKAENISTVEVINHHDASGKWCPTQILNGQGGLTWSWFKGALGGAPAKVTQGGSEKAPSRKPAYSGSIVDYLNQQGIKSNINNRKNLAVEYGIVSNEAQYTGTAKQNTALLNAMIKGEPKQEGTRKEPIQSGYSGNSLVDYLASIKVDNSFANRKKLASQNGISNYAGTAKQNTQLLNKMRGGGGGSTTKPTTKNNTTYTGTSLVDYLNLSDNGHLGGSSFNNRKKLAQANGISNYTGTASQNTNLLNKLRGGGNAPKQSTNKNVTNYTGSSIVNYLNLKGNSHLGGSSLNNRKKLAQKNGISNYRGTASQNTQLLNKLQGK